MNLFSKRGVVAVACSDVHLWLTPPLARQEEPDWKKAMNRALRQVRTLADKHGAIVLCAGDLFDRSNPPPELVNWAIDHLPHMYAIAGNHDLPTHRQDLEHRSAFGTLVRAGKITELGPEPLYLGNLVLYGRRLGEKIPKRIHFPADDLGMKHVLVTHEYVWTGKHGYYGAPKDRKLGKLAKSLSAFDVVVCGDNHRGFLRRLKSGTWFLGPGTLLRRKSDEADYRPRVGLIHEKGKVSLHFLSTKRDLISKTVDPKQEDDEEVAEFIQKLGSLEASSLSFREALLKALDRMKVRQSIRELVVEAMR